MVQDVRALAACLLPVTGAGVQAFGACPLPSWRVPCLLVALLLCLCAIALEYGSIWLFKGVFSGFYGCCVGLYCLGALRGLWGFCVRERLGGLKACGVFAFLFVLFVLLPLFLCSLPFLFSLCPSLL